MYQKTLIALDWAVVFFIYFLALFSSPLFNQAIIQLGQNTVNTSLNLTVSVIIGLVFIWFLAYLIKKADRTAVSSYAWLSVFFIITVFFLFKVETAKERLHFLGYGILSLVLYRALRHKVGTLMLYVWASVIIIVFAVLDENLQRLLGTASFELTDIGIDCLSGLSAQLLIILVARPRLKHIDIKIRKGMDKLERIKNFKSGHK